jgi:CRP-like cAMP-binding protein
MLLSQMRDRTTTSVSTGIFRHLELIGKAARVKSFRRGSTIPLEPSCISIVREGVVHLGTLYPSGDEAMIGLVYPGMPFGLPMTQVDPYIAIALTDVVLYCFPTEQIQQLPILAQLIAQQSSQRLRQTEALLAMLSYRRVGDRLRQFLILLAGEIGETTTVGISLNVRLTHQLIANATGTTRVTITRLLGQLQREGWLIVDQQNHIVLTRSSVS